MLLLSDRATYARVASRGGLTADFYDAARLDGAWPEIERRLGAGEDMLFIGLEGLENLRRVWLDADEPTPVAGIRMEQGASDEQPPVSGVRTEQRTADERTPVAGIQTESYASGNPTTVSGVRTENRTSGAGRAARWSFRPPSRYALHGVHEEPRVHIAELAWTRDAFGQDAGACGIRCRHARKSLCGGRFEGALWIALAAEPPMVSDGMLDALLNEMRCAALGVYIAELLPEYAWYAAGERVTVRARVGNRTDRLIAAELTLTLHGAETVCLPLTLNARDTQEVSCDFQPRAGGAYRIEAALTFKDRMVYGTARELPGVFAESRTECFRFAAPVNAPKAHVSGNRLHVGDSEGFLMGTHLYPSTTFFEASYRPMRLERAARDVAVMRKTGLALCRLWCDPVLDETSLRGMRALIELLGENGIAAIVTLFSSWTRSMRVGNRAFETADMIDDALIGLSFRDMDGQRAYISALAERLRDLPNVVWDLSNEFSVVDPPDERLGEWAAPGETTKRSIELLRRWAHAMRDAIRARGASQPMIYGVCCWDTGSDNALCNKDADIVATHLYCEPTNIRFLSAHTDPRAYGKPFLLEEFGGPWAADDIRARAYEKRYFEFLAAGFQGALNYEWGALWTSDVLPGTPPYMKFNSHTPDGALKGFHYEGRRAYAKTWTDGSAGVCPWIASTEYGVNRACVSGETRATRVMKQFARLTRGIPPIFDEPTLCVLAPFETKPYQPGVGYARASARLDALIDRLWSAGARFLLWQADEAESVPAYVETILCPNEYPTSLAARPDAANIATPQSDYPADIAARPGVMVYRGADAENYVPTPNPDFTVWAGENVRLVERRDASHRLLCLFAEGEARVSLYGYDLSFEESAMLCEACGVLRAAAVRGSLHRGDQCLCRATMRAGALWEKDTVYLPFGAGEIALGAPALVAAEDGGREIARFRVADGVLRVGADECGYAYRVLSEHGEDGT